MNGVNMLKHQRMEELLSSKPMNQKCDILGSKSYRPKSSVHVPNSTGHV